MKKIYSILLTFGFLFVLAGCESDDTIPESELGTTHFAFGTQTFDFGVDIGGESTNDIEVYSAFTTSSDRTLDIMVMAEGTTLNAAAYSVPATVTIPANSNKGLLSVTISDTNLNPDGEVLVIGFPEKAGEYVADSIIVNISQLCPSGTVNMKLVVTNQDGYPEEAEFQVVNSSGNIILTLSAGSLPASGIETKGCLPAGEYTLNVGDTYGDGGTTYDVYSDGVLLGTISGSAYTSSASLTFTL
jgi:hypothetical protein